MHIHVNRDEALGYLGYGGQPLDAAMEARLDALFAQVEAQSRPGQVHRIYPLEKTSEGLVPVGSGLILTGESIAAHLEGATQVAILCATLGLANDMAYRRLAIASTTDAAIFSAGGSSLVEAAADAAEALVAAEAAAQGLHTGWRFSPGYGDLPLSLQPGIIRALEATKLLGVTANEACLMTPVKTVTALVGLFPDGAGNPTVKRTCADCACADHCTLREVKPCHER